MITNFSKYVINEGKGGSKITKPNQDLELVEIYEDFANKYITRFEEKYKNKWIVCKTTEFTEDETYKTEVILKVDELNINHGEIFIIGNRQSHLLDLSSPISLVDDILEQAKKDFIGKDISLRHRGKQTIINVKDVIFNTEFEKGKVNEGYRKFCFIDAFGNQYPHNINHDVKIVKRVISAVDPYGEEEWEN